MRQKPQKIACVAARFVRKFPHLFGLIIFMKNIRDLLLFLPLGALFVLGLTSCSAPTPTPGAHRVAGTFSAAESNATAGGLRFGDKPLSKNAIDSLLAGPDKARRTQGARAEMAPAPAVEADDRPGLATSAGADKFSSVQDTQFYRKSATQPDATDSFHYNDERGAKAMAEALGGGSKHGGTFSAANGLLKVGLERAYGNERYPYYEASGRRIVIGDSGAAYEIYVKNTTSDRLEIVASVDGLSVMNGKAASVSQHGYVLDPKEEIWIEGFRENSSNVKRFQFGSVSDSEAAKKGQSRNVGVIGLAVYVEDKAAAKAAQLAEAGRRGGALAFPRQ